MKGFFSLIIFFSVIPYLNAQDEKRKEERNESGDLFLKKHKYSMPVVPPDPRYRFNMPFVKPDSGIHYNMPVYTAPTENYAHKRNPFLKFKKLFPPHKEKLK